MQYLQFPIRPRYGGERPEVALEVVEVGSKDCNEYLMLSRRVTDWVGSCEDLQESGEEGW